MKHNFVQGEIRCANCGDGLPAFQTSRKLHAYACKKPACKRAVFGYFMQETRTVAEGEVTCSLEGCCRPVKPGTYQKRKKVFFCSYSCERKHYRQQFVIGTCLHCNGPIHAYPHEMGKRRFCSNQHQLAYRGRRHTKARAGVHGEILDFYLQGFARVHYKPRSWNRVRNTLVAFFEYLDKQALHDLEKITAPDITAYIVHEHQRGLQTHGYVSEIKTFFEWLLSEGRRKAPNPVVNNIHGERRSWKPPRPFSEREMRQMWSLVEERGTTLLKLAFAFGEECGLRVSEVNNIRLEDVDQVEQRVFIRTPNKTDTPRRPFFHEKVQRYLAEWLKERDPHCGHDFLLHRPKGQFIKEVAYFQSELKDILCAGFRYPTGMPSFSFHRLRHTWATRLADVGTDIAVVMELGGWKSLAGVSRYIRISEQRKHEAYQVAMEKMKEQRELGEQTSISIADLAVIDAIEDANGRNAGT